MKTVKILSVCFTAILLSIGGLNVTYGSESTRGVTSDSIRIGIDAPLTRFLANAGRQSVAAWTAYANYINDSGGINGRKVVLVVDDSQLDPSISLGIFKKQLANDNIFAHISWGTPAAAVQIKPAMEEKMPLLIIGGAKPFYIPPKKYVFCFMPPYELQSAACVTYIHDTLKKKDAKIAIFWRNDDYGKTAWIGGKAAAKYYNYKVVAEPSYMLGQAVDFTSEVLKIRRAKADYVLLGSSVGDVSGFLREAKNQRLNATIFGALCPCSERKIIYQAGEAAENYHSVFTNAMFSETHIPGVKWMLEWSKKYAPKKILDEESYYYIFTLHPFMVILDAIKAAGANPTQESFVAALESIKNHEGKGIGAPISFSPDKHYSADKCYIGKVNMQKKDFERVTGWFQPPQDLVNEILK